VTLLYLRSQSSLYPLHLTPLIGVDEADGLVKVPASVVCVAEDIKTMDDVEFVPLRLMLVIAVALIVVLIEKLLVTDAV
jgi:hypothetical protein